MSVPNESNLLFICNSCEKEPIIHKFDFSNLKINISCDCNIKPKPKSNPPKRPSKQGVDYTINELFKKRLAKNVSQKFLNTLTCEKHENKRVVICEDCCCSNCVECMIGHSNNHRRVNLENKIESIKHIIEHIDCFIESTSNNTDKNLSYEITLAKSLRSTWEKYKSFKSVYNLLKIGELILPTFENTDFISKPNKNLRGISLFRRSDSDRENIKELKEKFHSESIVVKITSNTSDKITFYGYCEVKEKQIEINGIFGIMNIKKNQIQILGRWFQNTKNNQEYGSYEGGGCEVYYYYSLPMSLSSKDYNINRCEVYKRTSDNHLLFLKFWKGKFTFKDGDYYNGTWFNNKKEGKGEYFYSKTGEKYNGDWKNNQKEGKGVYIFKSGMYSGDWKNNKKNGNGKLEFYENNWEKDKCTVDGKWEDDCLIKGVYVLPYGYVCEINYINNRPSITIKNNKSANKEMILETSTKNQINSNHLESTTKNQINTNHLESTTKSQINSNHLKSTTKNQINSNHLKSTTKNQINSNHLKSTTKNQINSNHLKSTTKNQINSNHPKSTTKNQINSNHLKSTTKEQKQYIKKILLPKGIVTKRFTNSIEPKVRSQYKIE